MPSAIFSPESGGSINTEKKFVNSFSNSEKPAEQMNMKEVFFVRRDLHESTSDWEFYQKIKNINEVQICEKNLRLRKDTKQSSTINH